MFDDDKLLTVDDMARIFSAPNARAFVMRLRREQLLPPEQRLIPEPINKVRRKNRPLYWSPTEVAAVIRGENLKRRR